MAGVQSLDFSSTQPHDKWFAQQPGRQQQAARVCYVCGEHEFRARSSQSAIGEMGTRLENFNKNAWQQDCLRDDSAAQQLLLFPLDESNRTIIDASLIAHGGGIF